VVAGWATVSCVVVVVVVSVGCEAHELRSIMAGSASTDVRVISFFIDEV
jgi:hypothetical protein